MCFIFKYGSITSTYPGFSLFDRAVARPILMLSQSAGVGPVESNKSYKKDRDSL